MALVVRHPPGTGLSEFALGTDQNRFDVEDYWDKKLQVAELSKSVCTFVNPKYVVNKSDIEFQPLSSDAEGPNGIVLRASHQTYEDYIWEVIANRIAKKRDELLLNLSTPEISKAEDATPQDKKRLDELPWPKRADSIAFKNKFASQPLYGSATGFMVGDGIVATAAHAIHNVESPSDYDAVKVVFNLRAVPNTVSGIGVKGASAWKYVFDEIYDVQTIISHSGVVTKGRHDRYKALSIPEYFSTMNSVYDDIQPQALHDLCLLQLKPISGKAWIPELKIREDQPGPPDDPKAPPAGECFVIGSPNGLPFKVSGHENGRSSPRILKPVQGFYANFTCDVDILHANSGGPIFYHDFQTGDISVIGLVRAGRLTDWGLSSETSPDPNVDRDDKLMTTARKWIQEKLDDALKAGRIDAKQAKSLTLDKSFFTSYGGMNFYEKLKLVDINRFSEYSPVWKDYNNFNRADFLKVMVSRIEAWKVDITNKKYRPNRFISLRLELSLSATSNASGLIALRVGNLLNIGNTSTRWTMGHVGLSNNGSGNKFKATLCWTRNFDRSASAPEFHPQDFNLNASGEYEGDITPETFESGKKLQDIAAWSHFVVLCKSESGQLPDDLDILPDARMVLSFHDTSLAGSLELIQKLTFSSDSGKKSPSMIPFQCDFKDNVWTGPTVNLSNKSTVPPMTSVKPQESLQDEFFRERTTRYVDIEGKGLQRQPDEDKIMTREEWNTRNRAWDAEGKARAIAELDKLLISMPKPSELSSANTPATKSPVGVTVSGSSTDNGKLK